MKAQVEAWNRINAERTAATFAEIDRLKAGGKPAEIDPKAYRIPFRVVEKDIPR